MAFGFDPGLMIFGVGLLLMIAALLLARRGLFPPRVGDESRCKRCNYQLQGIESDRCPECGLPISPANTVHGQRQRRPGTILLAAITLMIGLTFSLFTGAAIYQRVEWYEYRPTSWVIGDIEQSTTTDIRAWDEINRRTRLSPLTSQQSDRLAEAAIKTLPASLFASREWTELLRQDAAGTLSAKQRLELIDRAIQAQAAAKPNADSILWTWTAKQLLADGLSPDRREAFLSHLLQLTLSARPTIARDAVLPYSIHEIGRGPDEPVLWYRQQLGKVRIDDRTIQEKSSYGRSGEGFNDGFSGSQFNTAGRNLPLGNHTLHVDMTLQIFSGRIPAETPDDLKDNLLWQKSMTLDCPLTIVADPSQDSVTSIARPDLQAKMASCISASHLSPQSGYAGTQGMSVQIDYVNVPMDIAFDVIAVVDGKEHRISSIAGKANVNGSYSTSGGDFDATKLTSVDLLLRSSESAARKTVDITQIWKGELLLKGVPVVLEKQNGR